MITSVSQIQRIRLVDDDPDSLVGYGYTIEDADLQPVPASGPLGTLDNYLAGAKGDADAGLSDFDLHTRSYAGFSGAQLVKSWYESEFPGILCTRYEKAQIEKIRPYRRWIPSLLKPEELNPDSLMEGFEACIREFQGKFTAVRRPWRTQVHFLHPDEETHNTYFVEVPGWSSQEFLRIRLDDLPIPLRSSVAEDFRCHAYANIGTPESEELYLCDWELP